MSEIIFWPTPSENLIRCPLCGKHVPYSIVSSTAPMRQEGAEYTVATEIELVVRLACHTCKREKKQ